MKLVNPSFSGYNSSGAIQRALPRVQVVVEVKDVASIVCMIIDSPKSLMQAFPWSSTSTFTCQIYYPLTIIVKRKGNVYAFDVTMNDAVLM